MVRTILIIAVILAVAVYGYMRLKGRTFSQAQKDIKEKVDDTINNIKNNKNNINPNR